MLGATCWPEFNDRRRTLPNCDRISPYEPNSRVFVIRTRRRNASYVIWTRGRVTGLLIRIELYLYVRGRASPALVAIPATDNCSNRKCRSINGQPPVNGRALNTRFVVSENVTRPNVRVAIRGRNESDGPTACVINPYSARNRAYNK